MKRVFGLICIGLVISAAFICNNAYAHRSPPQEIFNACMDKASGDVCSFVTPSGEGIDGTCNKLFDAETLVCRPDGNNPPAMDGGDHQGPKGPPQEAINACVDKVVGNDCSITTPRGDSIDGICDQAPDSETIACRPKEIPQHR